MKYLKCTYIFTLKMFIENLLSVKLYAWIWDMGWCYACTRLCKVGKSPQRPFYLGSIPFGSQGQLHTNFLHVFFILLFAFLKILECKMSHEKDYKSPRSKKKLIYTERFIFKSRTSSQTNIGLNNISVMIYKSAKEKKKTEFNFLPIEIFANT